MAAQRGEVDNMNERVRLRTFGPCALCHKEAKLRCSVCKMTRYCSRSCFKLHWNDHKEECQQLKRFRDRGKSVKQQNFVGGLRNLIAQHREIGSLNSESEENDDNSCDEFNRLPVDIVRNIISKLNAPELTKLALVSKKLRRFCNHEQVWSRLCSFRKIKQDNRLRLQQLDNKATLEKSVIMRTNPTSLSQQNYLKVSRRVEAIRSGKYKMCRLQEHYNTVECLEILSLQSLSRNGEKVLVSGAWDGTMSFWSLNENKCIRTFNCHEGWISCIALSNSDSNFCEEVFASGDTEGYILIWNALDSCKRGCGPLARMRQPSSVTGMKFLNGRFVASVAVDGYIRIWDIFESRCIQTVRGPHRDTVWGLQIIVCSQSSANTVTLCTTSRDGVICLWIVNNETGSLCNSVAKKEHQDAILCLSPPIKSNCQAIEKGKSERWLVATGATDSTVKIWNLDVGENLSDINLAKTLHGHVGGVLSVVLAHWQPGAIDTAEPKIYCVSGGVETSIRLWDVEDGTCLSIIVSHTLPVTALRVYDRLLFALADNDGLVAFYCTPPTARQKEKILSSNETSIDSPSTSGDANTSTSSSRLARRIRTTVSKSRAPRTNMSSGVQCFHSCFSQYDGIQSNYSSALAIDDGNFVALGSKSGEIWLMEFT